jgi:5-formyltetrahydrofolate cyclo-ligase
MTEPRLSKAAQRQAILAKLRTLDDAKKTMASMQACHHVFQWILHEHIDEARRGVLLFKSLKDEISTNDLDTHLRRLGIPRYLPVLPKPNTDGIGVEKIPEFESVAEFKPKGMITNLLESVGLIVLPGLAFNLKTGERLGRGLGFYDRLLAQLRKASLSLPHVALFFDEQVVHEVASEPHDQKVLTMCTPMRGIVHASKI